MIYGICCCVLCEGLFAEKTIFMKKKRMGNNISEEEDWTVTFVVQQVTDTERVKSREREKS